MCSNHTDTYSRVAPSRDIFARKKTEYNYHLVYKPNMPNPSVTPPVTKRQSVRMKRQESSDLSERQCSKIKCEFYRVFQTVNQFEESMAQSLTRAERNEVSNLVLPALNTLTGISGYRNGNSMMPAQPPNMSPDLYVWAQKMYKTWVPLRKLWREHPDLSTEGFFEWQRRNGQQNAEFERFCDVKD